MSSSETCVSDHSAEEVDGGVEKISPAPKVSGEIQEPKELPGPVATCAEAEKIESCVTEKANKIEDDKLVSGAPLVDTLEFKTKDEVIEIASNEEEKKIEDAHIVEASNRDLSPSVDKVSVPEPDAGCASEPVVVPKIESQSVQKFEAENGESTDDHEAVAEKECEPEKVVKLPEQSSNQDVQDKVEIVGKLPEKVTESTGESVSKAPEISDSEPVEGNKESKVETVQEMRDEPKVENVDEATEEEKVKGSECEAEGISETDFAEKLEQQKAKSVEETPEEPVKIVGLPVQSSDEFVEKEVENVEKQTVKEVEANTKKETEFSGAEATEIPEESKVELVQEKVCQPTKVIDVPEHSTVEEKEEKVETLPVEEVDETEEKESKVSVEKTVDVPKQSSVEKEVEDVEELPVKEVEKAEDKEVKVSEVECKPEDISETYLARKLEEPTKIVDDAEPSSVNVLEEKEKKPAKIEEKTTENELNLSEVEHKPEEISDPEPVESVEYQSTETTKSLEVPEQSLIEERLEKVEELHFNDVEAVGDKEVECEPEVILETDLARKLEEPKAELVDEISDKPTKIDDVAEESSVKVLEDKDDKEEELSAEIVEKTTDNKEISDPMPVGSVEEMSIQKTKALDEPEQSQPEEKLKKVEELDAKEIEAVGDREVNASEVDCKPEDILETCLTRELEEPKAELVDEKSDKPIKIGDVSEQPLIKVLEEKDHKVEELPAQIVDTERELKVSKVEHKHEEISDSKTVESIEEIPTETTKAFGVPEQPPTEEKLEKAEELHCKDVEEVGDNEVKVLEVEPKPEDDFAGKVEESKQDEPTTIVDVSEPLVEVCEEKKDKGKESPAEIVEETIDKESNVSEPEHKHIEISDPKPVVSVEKTIEENFKDVEALPAKEVESVEAEAAKVSEASCEPEEVSQSNTSEKLEESQGEVVKENTSESIKTEQISAEVDGEKEGDVKKDEQVSAKLVDETAEKEVKFTKKECKVEDISEAETPEKLEESKIKLVEEKPEERLETVYVQEQSTSEVIENKVEKEEELCAQEGKSAIEKDAIAAEILDKSKDKSVEGKLDDSVKTLDVEVVPDRIVEETTEKEVKFLESECKLKDISESGTPEKLEESNVELVEEKPGEVTETVDVPEESTSEAIEKKVERGEDLCAQEVPATREIENEVPEAKIQSEAISGLASPEKWDESKPEVVEKNFDEPKVSPVGEKVSVVEELPAEEVETSEEKEKIVSEAKCVQEMLETAGKQEESKEQSVEENVDESPVEEKVETEEALHAKEVVVTAEEEAKFSEPECELKEITETEPVKSVDERQIEPEKFVVVEELSPVDSNAAKLKKVEQLVNKEPETNVENEVKLIEAECKLGEISESASSVEQKPVEQSEVTGQSSKELLAAVPVKNVEEVCSVTDEIPEKIDVAKEEAEPAQKTLDIGAPPEEKISEPKNIGLETEAQEEKTEEKVCETKSTDDADSSITAPEVTDKPVEVTSKDSEPVAEDKTTKDETCEQATTEGNGDEEASKEAERSEAEKKKEDPGRSLKEKLEQEKHDYETNIQNTESTNEHEDAHTEEVPAKSGHKQSNNIIKMVKHSLVKAKKAIIGKSAHPKAPISEVKGDETCK